MPSNSELTVQNPSSIFQKEIKVNPRALISTLGKAAVNGAFLQFDDLAENGIELLDALGLESTPGEMAGLLIVRSLMSAFRNLQYENRELLEPEKKPENLKPLYEKLTSSLSSSNITVDSSFFEHPERIEVIQEAKIGFERWLLEVVEEPRTIHARNISSRLDAYFIDALSEEWIYRSQDYASLQEYLDTPFTRANRRQQGWLRYRAWLQKKVEEPMFLESFSLQKIYVPIRAFYLEETQENQTESVLEIDTDRNQEKIVTDLAEALNIWICADEPDDAIRLITGGPGSGKSSFARIFAAQQAQKNEVSVLFISNSKFQLTDNIVADWQQSEQRAVQIMD